MAEDKHKHQWTETGKHTSVSAGNWVTVTTYECSCGLTKKETT